MALLPMEASPVTQTLRNGFYSGDKRVWRYQEELGVSAARFVQLYWLYESR